MPLALPNPPQSARAVVALAAVLLAAPAVRAQGALDLPFVAAATATDDGPQDGIFDQFAPYNYGSVNDNGWTSFRTALEYDLSRFPAGTAIGSASLRFAIGVWEGPRSLAVHAYAGDGQITLPDFSRDGYAGGAILPATGTVTAEIDVTDAVRALVASGAAFAGFTLREDPPNAPNYVVMFVEMGPNAPVLRIAASSPPPPPPPVGCVVVAGGTPPVVALAPTPALLWPPQHQLVPIDLRAGATDGCGEPVPVSCEATSSEPYDALADGATSPDVVWTDGRLSLRAERAADGHGRTYTVACRATDAAGNSAQAQGVVTVPHDARPVAAAH